MEDKEKTPVTRMFVISGTAGFISWFLFSLGADGDSIISLIGGVIIAIVLFLVLAYQNRLRDVSDEEDGIEP